jgi:putative endonuclease
MSRGALKELPELLTGWCCYLLLCADDSYYCGITSNLSHRVRDHAYGKGGNYTKLTKPKALVWYSPESDRHSAARRERQIKSWSNEKKQKLANGLDSFAGMGVPVQVSLGQARDKLIHSTAPPFPKRKGCPERIT